MNPSLNPPINPETGLFESRSDLIQDDTVLSDDIDMSYNNKRKHNQQMRVLGKKYNGNKTIKVRDEKTKIEKEIKVAKTKKPKPCTNNAT